MCRNLAKVVGLKRLKLAIFNELQVSLNNILSEIFDILAVDNQMVISCGRDEPHRSPK